MEELVKALTIGVTNGLIIALIAIGYTLVYGILELINFAHADVFMLGHGVHVLRDELHRRIGWASPRRQHLGAAADLHRAADRHAADGRYQRRHRTRGLSAIAQRASPGATHQRDRHVVRPPEHRSGHPRPIAVARSRTGPPVDRPRHVPQRRVLVRGRRGRRPVGDAAAAARTALVRRQHSPGQGDARDRAGPRGLGAHGHRRQPDHLADVPDRRRPGRRGRSRSSPCTTARRSSSSASSSACCRSPRLSLAGSATSPARPSGGLVLGLVAAMSDRFLEAKWTTVIVFAILILVLVFRPTGLLAEKQSERA